MIQSQIVKKGGISTHLAYGNTFSNNLYAYNSTIIYEPQFAVYFDLTKNLRKRNKSVNQYIDAKELADGGIKFLTLFQIDDKAVINEIILAIKKTSSYQTSLKLEIELGQVNQFLTKLELFSIGLNRTLNFNVLEKQ